MYDMENMSWWDWKFQMKKRNSDTKMQSPILKRIFEMLKSKCEMRWKYLRSSAEIKIQSWHWKSENQERWLKKEMSNSDKVPDRKKQCKEKYEKIALEKDIYKGRVTK